jgi:hypothetical protein
MQVVLSWKAGGSIRRRVVTRKLSISTVLSSYCRALDVPVAAALLAKGVLQDIPSATDAGDLASTRESIGAFALSFISENGAGIDQQEPHCSRGAGHCPG